MNKSVKETDSILYILGPRGIKKTTLKYVLSVVALDVRSVTGRNLAKISSRCNLETFDDICPKSSKVPFRKIPEGQEWRRNIAKEIIQTMNENLEVPGFDKDELNTLLTWITTTGPS